MVAHLVELGLVAQEDLYRNTTPLIGQKKKDTPLPEVSLNPDPAVWARRSLDKTPYHLQFLGSRKKGGPLLVRPPFKGDLDRP